MSILKILLEMMLINILFILISVVKYFGNKLIEN